MFFRNLLLVFSFFLRYVLVRFPHLPPSPAVKTFPSRFPFVHFSSSMFSIFLVTFTWEDFLFLFPFLCSRSLRSPASVTYCQNSSLPLSFRPLLLLYVLVRPAHLLPFYLLLDIFLCHLPFVRLSSFFLCSPFPVLSVSVTCCKTFSFPLSSRSPLLSYVLSWNISFLPFPATELPPPLHLLPNTYFHFFSTLNYTYLVSFLHWTTLTLFLYHTLLHLFCLIPFACLLHCLNGNALSKPKADSTYSWMLKEWRMLGYLKRWEKAVDLKG